MKKTVAVSLLAIGIVVIAITYLFIGGDKAPGKSAAENFVAAPSTTLPIKKVLAVPTSGTASLQELLTRAEDLECSVSYQKDMAGLAAGAVNEKPVTGTYFTSNGMMRGDFILPEALANSVSSIILRDNTMYNWSEIEGEKYGVKFDISTRARAESPGEMTEAKGPVPVDQPVDFQCKPWVKVDGSVFEPPTDVMFKDVTDMKNINMEYGTTYEQTGISAQCELCKKVSPGPGQDECKATFKCQ